MGGGGNVVKIVKSATTNPKDKITKYKSLLEFTMPT